MGMFVLNLAVKGLAGLQGLAATKAQGGLASLGEAILQMMYDHVDDEEGPNNTPWPALQPATLEERTKQGFPYSSRFPMLVRGGILMRSYDVLEAAPTRLVVGSRYWLAAVHHHGSEERNIPARIFAYLDEGQVETVRERIGQMFTQGGE